MKRLLLGLLFTLIASAAHAQCSGLQPAGSVCGNASAAQALSTPSRTPVLGLPGTALGSLGLAGSASGTVTVRPGTAAGTYNFVLPSSAGNNGNPLLSAGGGTTAMRYGIERILRVADFATCNGSTDDTAGFISLATAANAIGYYVRIEFPTNATCNIWPNDASATANPILWALTLANSTINFNGSHFHSLYTGNLNTNVIVCSTCVNTQINGYAHVSDRGKQDSGAGQGGVFHLTYTAGSVHNRVFGMTATGGSSAIACARSNGSAVVRSYDLDVDMDVTNVYYPGGFQNDCDSVRGLFKSTNSGRPYISYNNRDHDVTIVTTNQTSQIEIQAFASAVDTSATTGYRMRVIDQVSTVCNIDPLEIRWSQANPAIGSLPAQIDLDLEYVQNNAACGTPYSSYVVTTSFINSAGSTVAGDTTHFGNVRVHGSIIGNPSSATWAKLLQTGLGFGNSNKIQLSLENIAAQSVTRNVGIGVGTGQRISLRNVWAPSSSLTFDGAVSATNFVTDSSTFSNWTPASRICGGVILIAADASESGRLTCDTTAAYVRSSNARPLRFGIDSTDYAGFTANSFAPLTDNAVALGGASFRWSDLRTVNATIGVLALTNQAGTWTPVLRFGGTSTGLTVSSAIGRSQVVGDTMIASYRLTLTNKGSSTGVATVSGLPNLCNGSVFGFGGVAYYTNLASITGPVSGTANSGVVTYQMGGAVSVANLTEANFTNTSDIIGSVVCNLN